MDVAALGPGVHEGDVGGHRAVMLVSKTLAVTILPARGAELHALVDRASGIDVLFHAPWGLPPPGASPRAGSDGHPFLETYAGGWQELFPSVNDACVHRGQEIPFHGEVAVREWTVEPIEEAGTGAAVRCTVACRTAPFTLERVVRLSAHEPRLTVTGTVRNTSSEPAHLVWGHHCVLGAPFLEAGCVLEVEAGTVVTIPELWEDTARLEPGQSSPWPYARLRTGGTVDLSKVPGEEAGSHDDVYLGDLRAGRAAVRNPRLGLAFVLEWDATIFRWVIAWQAYGGARAMPLAGSYALGIEPWVARTDLAAAVASGAAIELGGGASLATEISVRLERSAR